MRVLLALSVFSAAFAQFVLVASARGFTRYPDYVGALVIDGTVQFFADGLAHNVTVNLTGAEPDGNVSVHIHSGVSCNTTADVGGHLWTPFADVDPWAVVRLPVDGTGAVDSYFSINFGYDKTDFVRHAVVIHNSTGGRVACATITDEPPVALAPHVSATLDTYPGYSGGLTVRGEINVWDVLGSELQVNYRLTGLQINSTGGLHIHVGLACDSAGGHYWLPANDTDPWLVAQWESDGMGKAEGTFHLAVGLNQENVTHRAVVVHDSNGNGTRVACGLLGGPGPTDAPTDSPTPGPTPATDGPTPAPTPANATDSPTPAPTPANATDGPTPAPTPANATEGPTPNTPPPSSGAPTTAPPSSGAPTASNNTEAPSNAPTAQAEVSGASAVVPVLALAALPFLL